MRMIDADELLQSINAHQCADCEEAKADRNGVACAACQWDDAISMIENAPTVAIGDRWATIKWTPDLDKFAQDVAYRGLNEFSFMGKSIREWVEIIMEQMATKTQSEWVSVQDKQPEQEGLYLCRTLVNGVRHCYQICLWYHGGWRWLENVQYWMQLPEPPEGESNEV